MKIFLQVEKPEDMRYKTCGDWYETSDGIAIVSAVDTGNDEYNFCILMHELTEYILCKRDGITDKQVDDWDLSHINSDDPGIIKGSPYRDQHMSASIVEDFFLSLFKSDPYEYEKVVAMASYVVDKALNRKEAKEEGE